ncbi:MAG: hypothetical protein Q4G59_01025 [Planctomycetia bacterium]|nr:hypothetical protein [Planctomycetia bacterium]
MAKSGFRTEHLPNILIIQFDRKSGKKFYVSVSMDKITNYVISEENAQNFWDKFEGTLVKLQKGESLEGGSVTVSNDPAAMARYFRGILLVDPPTSNIQDYATTKIKQLFPDTPLRVYDGDK